MTSALHWTTIAAGHTGRLAVRGELVAAATLDRLGLWGHGAVPLAAVSPVRAPGWPVLSEGSVCWGPGRLTLSDGEYRATDGLLALCDHGRRVPQAWAWRDDGERVLVCLANGGPGSAGGTQAVLADAEGHPVAELRHDPEAAAAAACVGQDVAVVGSAHASVHGSDGYLRYRLDNPTPALRLALCRGESLLLLVENGRLSLYDMAEGSLSARWEGAWIDAAPSPDGRRLLALDVQGRLARLDSRDATAAPGWLAADDPAQAVAADGRHIVAAFACGAPLRRTRWPGG
jgi:hypothetical protein